MVYSTPEQVLQEAYLTLHNNCGLHIGDVVMVVNDCSGKSPGWKMGTDARREDLVDHEGLIVGDNGAGGFVVEIGTLHFSFPYHGLRLIKSVDEFPKEIGGQSILYNEHGERIKINCQYIEFPIIKGIFYHLINLKIDKHPHKGDKAGRRWTTLDHSSLIHNIKHFINWQAIELQRTPTAVEIRVLNILKGFKEKLEH